LSNKNKLKLQNIMPIPHDLSNNAAWICMFTPETWEQAEKTDFKYSAFTSSRRKAAERIRPGDTIFPYVSKRMTLSGVLIVEEECSFNKDSDIYLPAKKFPCIVKCRPHLILDRSNEISMASHFHRISIFSGLKDGRYWPVCLRNSPRDIRRRDRDYIYAIMGINHK